MPTPAIVPDRSPVAIPAAIPCPCGRAHTLGDCCLPLAERLRTAGRPDGRPTPFDEIKASCSLLLWSVVSGAPGGRQRRLSAAARHFWGIATAPPEVRERNASCTGTREGPARTRGQVRGFAAPSPEPRPIAYGAGLFERTWGAADAETSTWLLAALPLPARVDEMVAEMALDWLLWDFPWIRGRPAAARLLAGASFAGCRRVRRAGRAILASRLGLWRLQSTTPGSGFLLRDELTGREAFIDTPSAPWPDPERLLLARVYRFGRWRLIGGRCLLLEEPAAAELRDAIHRRSLSTAAPAPTDPRWPAWLKAELAPVAVGRWLAHRLALPDAARYHGTCC